MCAINSELANALIPGTDADVAQRYASLAKRAATQRFGLIEPEFVVLDTETTGFSPERDALIEIAAAIVSGPQIMGHFSTFVDPGIPIPELITELTGISDADVQGAPSAQEAIEKLAEFAGTRRIIAHNASFDQGFILAHKPTKLPKMLVHNQQAQLLQTQLLQAQLLQAQPPQPPLPQQPQPPRSQQPLSQPPLSQQPLPQQQPLESQPQPSTKCPLLSDSPWIDTVELARIALPRLRTHNLETLSLVFSSEQPSTHRALDDVYALCHIWRVILVALSDLPQGLPHLISGFSPDTPWGAREALSMIALDQAIQCGKIEAKELQFSLNAVRAERARVFKKQEKIDASELDGGILNPNSLRRSELERAYTREGLVGAMYPDYEPRIEQFEMACEVADAYNTSTHRAIEAGTGVGKSMGYLLPLALFAKRNRIIGGVATKTNALLDQLIYHELPRLAAALYAQGEAQRPQELQGRQKQQQGRLQQPHPQQSGLQYIALKGYDHYPCLRKLMRLSATGYATGYAAGHTSEHATGHTAGHATGHTVGRAYKSAAPMVLVGQLLAYVSQSSTGDLDPLHLWWQEISRFEVCASAEDCLRNKCRYYAHCLLHGARRQAANADIVVTNHALLFCDHLFGGTILPPISHWVIDEAHAAESEARSQLTANVELKTLSDILRQLFASDGTLSYLKSRAGKLDGSLLICGLIEHVQASAQATLAVAESFFSYVKDLEMLAEQSSYDRVDLWISPEIRERQAWGDVLSTGSSLVRRLETLLKECRDVISACAAYDELLEQQSDLSGLVMNLQETCSALMLILDGTNEDYVYYAELDRRENVLNDRLVAAILDVGATLANDFYSQQSSVVFTSATIAIGEDFSSFKHGIGLDRITPELQGSLRLDSSYDFDRNMTVYLPNDIPEPNAPGYTSALEELLFKIHVAMNGSVLTLFTNRREMEKLYEALNPRLAEQGLALKCQFRSLSAKRLRDEFIENKALSLFALRSFWEGFDAPGDTLRCVIIPKLPFGRPNDPLQLERARREQNAWKQYVLPEAIIDLKQAAGRLIRSSTDKGYLVLADARLRTKWYGPSFLAALPSRRHYFLSTQQIAEQMQRER